MIHGGRKPRKKTISTRIGILMSASMSPQRFSVTSFQLRLANSTTTTARRTQKRVERNRMAVPLGERCVERQNAVRPALQSLHRNCTGGSVEGAAAARQTIHGVGVQGFANKAEGRSCRACARGGCI